MSSPYPRSTLERAWDIRKDVAGVGPFMFKNHLKRLFYSPEKGAETIAQSLVRFYREKAKPDSPDFSDTEAIAHALESYDAVLRFVLLPRESMETKDSGEPTLTTAGPLSKLMNWIERRPSKNDPFSDDEYHNRLWGSVWDMRLGLGLHLWHVAVAIAEMDYCKKLPDHGVVADWHFMTSPPEHPLYVFAGMFRDELQPSKDLESIRRGVTNIIENPGIKFAREMAIKHYPEFNDSGRNGVEKFIALYEIIDKEYKLKTIRKDVTWNDLENHGGNLKLTYDFNKAIGKAICRVLGINEFCAHY